MRAALFARRAWLRCVFAVLWLPCGVLCCPSSRCVNRAVSFVERRCNSGSLPPRGEWSQPSPRSGPVRPLPARVPAMAPTALPLGGLNGTLGAPAARSSRCGSRRPARTSRGRAGVRKVLESSVSITLQAHRRHRFFACCQLRYDSVIVKDAFSSARTLCKTTGLAPPLTHFAISAAS